MTDGSFRLPAFTPEPPKQVEAPAPSPTLDYAKAPVFERPTAIHAEMTILGAMLVEPTAIQDAIKLLTADDFALDSHRKIYSAMVHLAGASHAVDIVTITNELRKRNQLGEVGGVAYLASLSEGLPRRLSIESYVRIVRDKSLMRDLMTVCDLGIVEASEQNQEALEIVTKVSQRLVEISERGRFNRNRKVLVGAQEFIRNTQPNVEWAVEGLVQLGGNGIIVGDPGTAKSFSALDLAFHLVTGVSWLGKLIPRRMKVAFVAREDHPGLTQHRAFSLIHGYQNTAVEEALNELELDECMYFNTRAQSETFSLQNEGDVTEIIDAFKAGGVEIAFFDVFRRLWEGDENDNREVAKVLATLTRIQTECGCSVVLIHHINKTEGGSIFQRIRGASSIYGWREWAFGISIENPEDDPKDRIRKIVFETKAATPAPPIYYCFDGEENAVQIATCAPPVKSYKKSKKSDDGPKQDVIPWYEGREAN